MLSRRMVILTSFVAPAIVRASSLGRLSRKSNLLLTPSIAEIPFPDEIKWDVDALDGIRITAMRFYGSRSWTPVTGNIPLELALPALHRKTDTRRPDWLNGGDRRNRTSVAGA